MSTLPPLLGTLTPTLEQNNSKYIPPINVYSIGVIKDVNLDNCMSFDGTKIVMKRCPLILNEFNDTYRFKFINGEIHDPNDKYCFTRNSIKEFKFEKINTYDSFTNNCYKFQKKSSFNILSDSGTCLGNNLDKIMSIPCNVTNWKMDTTLQN